MLFTIFQHSGLRAVRLADGVDMLIGIVATTFVFGGFHHVATLALRGRRQTGGHCRATSALPAPPP